MYPRHPDPEVGLHHRPGPNTTNNTPGNGRNDCAEFTHDTHKSRVVRALALDHWPNTTQTKSRQRPQRLCGIYPRTHKVALHQRSANTTQAGSGRNDFAEFTHAPTKSHCTIAPNTTTQTKAGNGRNDCAEFTHAPTKSPTKLRSAIAPNTTQTKAGNGRNDRAEFTHAPTNSAAPPPKHKQKTTRQRPH